MAVRLSRKYASHATAGTLQARPPTVTINAANIHYLSYNETDYAMSQRPCVVVPADSILSAQLRVSPRSYDFADALTEVIHAQPEQHAHRKAHNVYGQR
jgi:hypothetical protein